MVACGHEIDSWNSCLISLVGFQFTMPRVDLFPLSPKFEEILYMPTRMIRNC